MWEGALMVLDKVNRDNHLENLLKPHDWSSTPESLTL